jgi:peptide deformylase
MAPLDYIFYGTIMALLKILTAPNPRLHEKALPVEKVDKSVRKLMDDLLETMYHKNGIGLASVQAGIPKRVMVVDLGERHGIPFKPRLMANPELQWVSLETQTTEEGCLSVPQFYAKITRPLEAHVSYLDENNQRQYLKAQGLLADCIQHEIDHLNGILFIDHLSSLKRTMVLRKLIKDKKYKGSL